MYRGYETAIRGSRRNLVRNGGNFRFRYAIIDLIWHL